MKNSKNFKLSLTGLFLLVTSFIFAQSNITGTIIDSTGLPVTGVNVILENTNNGAITDFDGKEILYGKKNFRNPSLILKSKNIL